MSQGSNTTGGPSGGPGGRGGRRHHGRPGKRHHGGQSSRQRGGGAFVGPMDHSYRHVRGEVDGNSINGNATNLPPALGGQSQRNNNNRRGRFQRDGRQFQNQRGGPALAPPAFHQSVEPLAPSAAAVDAPTRIFIFVDDLFFVSKIQETARKLNVKVEFVKNYEDLLARMDAEPELKPSLIIFDLNNAAARPLTAIPKLRARLKKSASLLGFLSHLQGELKLKAVEAGCDSVVPRSAFSQNLPQILRRHGAGDEEAAAGS